MAAADDLFFHGHLLPLHLVAPRPSDFSAESFSLPKLSYQRDDTPKNSGENKERVKASSMTLEREWWRKKGHLSAPASTMASPRNSGLLSASAMAFSSPNSSSMEELQSAIQAAIAHCKKIGQRRYLDMIKVGPKWYKDTDKIQPISNTPWTQTFS
ncbi:hypothetical protein C4D60_Mb05t24970 [Musa balbisiana]|uniref:Uncharacterized protein n=1 Tax=Musa balbisiana TaxID=52838 RepID=A0A4S8JYN7_MUSBA|nr:hypothetical protein C4D60_Mb05t24970 [Musa balbisiana]